jgi:alpha-1,6-mannosyltransferase
VVRIAGPSLPYDPTYHLLWRVDKVRRIVRRERPDVLEIHSPYVAAASALSVPRADFGIRTFVWHSDFIDTYLRELLRKVPLAGGTHTAATLVRPLWAWVRRIATACDATLVAAEWQVEKLRAHGVPRVHHVPFGVDRATFCPEARTETRRAEILAALGPARASAAPGALLLVAVGRFAVEKRWDVLLDGYARIRERVITQDTGDSRGENATRGEDGRGRGHMRERGIALAIFGDGPEREAIQARIHAWPEVRLFGFEKDRKRLAGALACADLFVHACPFETFGLSVAEALACGTPAVVPDQGGAPELVTAATATAAPCGATYTAGDPDAFARAALAVLARIDDAGESRAIRAAARSAALRLPTPEEYFRRVFALYKDLLAA